MSNLTTRLNLIKPALTDTVGQTIGTDFPYNLDLLDTVVGATIDAISQLESSIAGALEDIIADIPEGNYLTEVLDDPAPELGGNLGCGIHAVTFDEYDGGTDGSGGSSDSDIITIDWTKGQKQKAVVQPTGSTIQLVLAVPPVGVCNMLLKLFVNKDSVAIYDAIVVPEVLQSFVSTDVAAEATDTIEIDVDVRTGTKVRFTDGGGTLPEPLVAGTDYYVIRYSSTSIRVAASIEDAYNGTYISFTNAGTDSIDPFGIYKTVKYAGGTAHTLSVLKGKTDILSFYYDGVDYYCVSNADFR